MIELWDPNAMSNLQVLPWRFWYFDQKARGQVEKLEPFPEEAFAHGHRVCGGKSTLDYFDLSSPGLSCPLSFALFLHFVLLVWQTGCTTLPGPWSTGAMWDRVWWDRSFWRVSINRVGMAMNGWGTGKVKVFFSTALQPNSWVPFPSDPASSKMETTSSAVLVRGYLPSLKHREKVNSF